jgi:probable rRNA maturation factor
MTVQFENEQKEPLDFDCREVAEAVIVRILDQENCPYEAEVSLTLTENGEIRRLNREFRQIDRETDVLSFPLVDFPAPADYRQLETDAGCFNPESGELMLGDIVISVEKAREQAEEYGHSLKREIAFLIAHSMLHLLGYDHMLPEEAEIMEEKQEEALQALKITRG